MWNPNLKTKMLAMGLVASQLSVLPWINYADAAVPAAPAVAASSAVASPASAALTPEEQLLTSAMIASSENLSQDQLKQSLAGAVSAYNKSAPQAGREDRMVNALVDMKFMTADRAQALRSSVDQSLQQQLSKGSSQASSSALVNQALASALSSDQGAEFSGSGCGAMVYGGAGLTALGGLAAFTGLIMAVYNPTCSTPSYETYYSDGSSATTYGPTTCTADEHPDAGTGDQLMIYGGIALGIGALALVLYNNTDACD